jgi:hypothetical protein
LHVRDNANFNGIALADTGRAEAPKIKNADIIFVVILYLL